MRQIIDQLQEEENLLNQQKAQKEAEMRAITSQLAAVQQALRALTASPGNPKSKSVKQNKTNARKQPIDKEQLQMIVASILETELELSREALLSKLAATLEAKNFAKHGIRSKLDQLFDQSWLAVSESGSVQRSQLPG